MTSPGALFVGLPIGHLEAGRFSLAPPRPRRFDGIGVFPIEKHHDALIRDRIAGHRRTLDEEAHDGAVRIVVVDGQHNGLLSRLGISPNPVREKRIVPPGPQMSVERLNALFRGGLDNDAPAALELFQQERRQDLLRCLSFQVIEEDFSHVVIC